MTHHLSVWTNKHALALYFVLAYAFSWAVEIPIALSVQGIIPTKVPLAIHYLASFGPLLAALVVASVTEGVGGLRRLFQGLLKWRVEAGYALFAIAFPAGLFAVAVVASWIMQGAWPDLGLLNEVDYLPPVGILPALGLWLLTYGFGEEMGWRGYALPRLQSGRSAYSAALLLGVLWAGWHIPAIFYRDTYTALGFLALPLLLFSVCIASIIITWLYNGTRGSLLMVILFHAIFNFFSVSEAGGDSAPIVMTAVIVFWAVRVVKVYGKENLAPVEKQTI